MVEQGTYDELQAITQNIVHTQDSLNRGLAYASGGVPKLYEGAKKHIARAFGKNYFIPDLAQTMQLQREHIHSFLMCIDGVLKKTATEIKGVQAYSDGLLQELESSTIKATPQYTSQKNHNQKQRSSSANPHSTSLPSASHSNHTTLQQISRASFSVPSISQRLNLYDISTYRAQIQRRRQDIKLQCFNGLSKMRTDYLKIELDHAIAIEELLLDSTFTAGKIQLEAQSYYKMLTQLVHSYGTLGLHAEKLYNIQLALSSMQSFTNGIQSQVGRAIVSLQRAALTPSSLENRLGETAQIVSNRRTQFLQPIQR